MWCVCVDLTELLVGGSGNFLPELAIGVYLTYLGRAFNISVLISLSEKHRTVKRLLEYTTVFLCTSVCRSTV